MGLVRSIKRGLPGPWIGADIMKLNSGVAAVIFLSFAVAGLSACEKKGPAEQAGEAIDNAAKKTGDKIEETGEKIKDAVED